MDGGGVSFGVTAIFDEGVDVENVDGTLALLLLTCFGVPGQISQLNGTAPGLLHESSIAAVIVVIFSAWKTEHSVSELLLNEHANHYI